MGACLAALAFGERYIVENAEPWLTVLSGVLIVLLAIRMLWAFRGSHPNSHNGHEHRHGHHHHHPPANAMGTSTGQIIWFGFTGGLLPCPAAIAVLLVCIQMKAFALGVAMVAAFSLGLALTLVAIGVSVAWSATRLSTAMPGFDRWASRLPYLSAGIVMAMGVVLTAAGLNALASRAPR